MIRWLNDFFTGTEEISKDTILYFGMIIGLPAYAILIISIAHWG